MKKIKLNAIVIALLLGVSFATVSCGKKDPQPVKPKPKPVAKEVVFEDKKLTEIIKAELKLKATEKVTEANIKDLKKLILGGKTKEVKTLKGLEKAVELTEIDFAENAVKDLSPIKDLKKVTVLKLSSTAVEDLKALANYSTLTLFDANAAKGIKDISPLAKNVNLQTLILADVPVADKGLETIKLFTKLHKLNLKTSGITKVDELAELMSKGALLKTTAGYKDGDSELILTGNTIKDYTPLDKYATTSVKVTK